MLLATYRDKSGTVTVGAVNRSWNVVLGFHDAARSVGFTDTGNFASMLHLMESGERGLDQALALVDHVGFDNDIVHSFADITWLAPVPVPAQIRDFSVSEQHVKQAGAALVRMRAERMGAPIPTESGPIPAVYYKQPVYYKGNRFSVVGHDQDVHWPSYTERLDYELEFGIFIGKSGKNIPKDRAREHIFGYTVFNDFSARDAQEFEMGGRLGPAKGKDFDTGNSMGPWILTADEIYNAYDLTMIARVNGEEWSRNNSSTMLHTFEDMIAFVSRDETLYPGEFFGSGTVGGGCGLELNRWLKPGDVVELEVEGIGVLRNRIVKPAP